MPRSLRNTPGGYVYHVLNRAVARADMFKSDGDFAAFERVLGEAVGRFEMRLLGYCLMSNHWHLVLWPRKDGQLSGFMQWLSVTHMRRWHASHGTTGTGPLYQGRFKSFPVQSDEHLLMVLRYVERNALRAGMVRNAENWRWNSLWRRMHDQCEGWLMAMADWPVDAPRDWGRVVNTAQTDAELWAVRQSITRNRPMGDDRWTRRTAGKLKLESSLRDPWRPKKKAVVTVVGKGAQAFRES
jgi:putative transposase